MTPLLMSYALGEISNQQSSGNAVAAIDLKEQQAAQKAELEKTSIMQEAKADKAKRKAALRRAVASQKASFASQGISSGGGSSEAVLLGMISDADEEQEEEENVKSLKLAAIDQDIEQEKALNVLQRAQLEEAKIISSFSNIF